MRLFFLAGLTGLLLSTSYIPFYPWALFFCLVPLFSAWTRETRPWRVFLLGWFSQFVFNAVGFHWIYHTASEFGHLPMLPSAIALIGFASFASLDLPIAGLLVCLIKRKLPLKPIYEVAMYALVFFIVQSLYPTIFPWNLGYPWYWANWPAVQWTDVIGFEGLSLITLLTQVLFWQIWQVRKSTRMVVRLSLLFLMLFLPLNILGYKKGQSIDARLDNEGRELKVLIIQANIGNLEKAYAERGVAYQDFILQEYFDLTKEALAKYPEADLVAYPETALPVALNNEYGHLAEAQRIKNFFKEMHKSFLVGAYGDTLPVTYPFNSVYLISANGEVIDSYKKTHLLAFGEYIPFGDYFPILYKWMPFISHFGRGPGPSVLQWDEIKVGIQICYEGLYPRFTRGLINKEANLLFNATNDSWFGKNFEPLQHFYMTAARSLEFRVPLVRATNTGISTVVSQTGKIGELSPLHQKWFGLYKVKLQDKPEPTLYAQFFYFVFFSAILMFVACLYLGRKRIVKSRAS